MSYYVHRSLALNLTPTLQTIEDHRMITECIYHWIRHPMYTAIFILFIASSLISASWIIGFLGLIYSLLILDRVRAEEKMMLETFGDEYQVSMQKTGRFLPKLMIL